MSNITPILEKVDYVFSQIEPTLKDEIAQDRKLITSLKQLMKNNPKILSELSENAYLQNNKPAYFEVWNVLREYKPEVGKHCERVANYIGMMGEELGWGKNFGKKYRIAGRLHDIGKILVPDNLLNAGKFKKNSNELNMVRQGHVILSEAIWDFLGFDNYDPKVGDPNPSEIKSGIIYHHDVADGYPHKFSDSVDAAVLKSQSVQPVAIGNKQDSLVTLGDRFDASVEPRTYQESLTFVEALGRIRNLESRGKFETRYVDALESVVMDRKQELKDIYHKHGIQVKVE